MKKIKILHSADIHFDTPFKDFDLKSAENNKRELKEVFTRIINIANERDVDILLLSGDIFDNYTVKKDTLTFIKEEIERLKRARVFISPGNHDPYNFKSFYKLIDWPKNTYIFKEKLEKVVLEDLKVCVFGAAFNENYVHESMLKDLNVDENYINIGVIHSEITKGNTTNEYNPISLDDIEKSNLDYLALGHRHKYVGVLKEGKTSYAYSGCPQGRGFDELDEKGVLLLNIRKNFVEHEFIKTCIREYKSVDIDITGVKNYIQLKNRVKEELEGFNTKIDIFKINLVGEIDSDFNIDENILKERLKDKFYFLKIKDKTKVSLNLDSLGSENSIKGIFVKKLKESMEEADENELEVINLALKLGLSSLTEEEVNLDDY